MKLLEPIKIGNIEIKNRIMMAPMTNNMTDNGFISDCMLDFYEERAKGGVGLITVEDGIVDVPIGNNAKKAVAFDDDKYIPMAKKLCAVIKKHDSKAVIQLSHAGRRAGRVTLSNGCMEVTKGLIAVAPSILAHPFPGQVTPRELRVEEIEEIVEKFAQAARRAVEAGFDLISIHCAHMYLCGEFLSPWANKRTDRYGGSLENRMRFVLEIIERIKKEIGEDFPLICRMNGQEPKGGNSLLEVREIARRLELAGMKAISVSTGFGAVLKDRDFISAEAPIGVPEGCIVHLAENIKIGVDVPVITANKIRHVDFAENLLQENRADMIALGRPLIADPYWVKKVEKGKIKDIRPCVSCCQGCVENVLKGIPITCILNPRVGKEGDEAYKVSRVSKGKEKKVLVIGGGPGGLQTALTAEQRGHKVTIWEKEKELGGTITLAAIPPGKEELLEIISYYENSVKQNGIDLELGKEAEKQSIIDFNPDIVVLAVGGKSIIPKIKGIDKGNVYIANQILKSNNSNIGNKIAVIGGGQVGVEVADWFAEKGKEVTVIEMLSDVASDMAHAVKTPLMMKLEDYNVRLFTNSTAREITDKGVLIYRKGEEEFIEADAVIIAAGAVPDRMLEESLKNSVPALYTIGDCNDPGKIMEAVHEGFKLALKI